LTRYHAEPTTLLSFNRNATREHPHTIMIPGPIWIRAFGAKRSRGLWCRLPCSGRARRANHRCTHQLDFESGSFFPMMMFVNYEAKDPGRGVVTCGGRRGPSTLSRWVMEIFLKGQRLKSRALLLFDLPILQLDNKE
jgi:hypothetical protein